MSTIDSPARPSILQIVADLMARRMSGGIFITAAKPGVEFQGEALGLIALNPAWDRRAHDALRPVFDRLGPPRGHFLAMEVTADIDLFLNWLRESPPHWCHADFSCSVNDVLACLSLPPWPVPHPDLRAAIYAVAGHDAVWEAKKVLAAACFDLPDPQAAFGKD